MQEWQRAELSELALRCIRTAKDETAALYALPPDMGEWTRTADAGSTARREFWEALYRLEVEEDDGPVRRVAKPRSRRKNPF